MWLLICNIKSRLHNQYYSCRNFHTVPIEVRTYQINFLWNKRKKGVSVFALMCLPLGDNRLNKFSGEKIETGRKSRKFPWWRPIFKKYEGNISMNWMEFNLSVFPVDDCIHFKTGPRGRNWIDERNL